MTLLGHALRDEFLLDRDFVTVNHGSYGATPKRVLAAQDRWRRQMEAQPSRFMRAELPDALRHAAGQLANFLGADGQDLAFVSNATEGCNAVLRSLVIAPGDEIVVLGHVYGAVRNSIQYLCDRFGARMVVVEMPFPRLDEAALLASLTAAFTPRTRLAVIDHITSSSAMVLPLPAIIAACHAVGVPILVDGAHGPGHVDIDLTALGADYYVGNCHKWLMAAKGCAFIWVRRDRQPGLHPTVISHGYGGGFLAEFDWTGTFDPSAYLSVTAALDFHAELGGAALRARNANLAAEAAALLAGRLGTETASGNAVAGAMALVRLPAPADRAAALRDALLAAGTDAPVQPHAGSAWLRLSAHAYNDISDFQALADRVQAVLRA
jgi:isopenicillin-N epimerase